MPKVALIEVYESHAECLYTQLQILKSEFEDVTLICPPGLKSQIAAFQHDQVIFQETSFSRKSIKKFRSFLNEQNFDLIIFNTAQDKLKKLFYFLQPLSCKNIYGTIHKVKKLKSSLGQRVISHNLKGYFVLSDYVKENAQELMPSLHFEAYYPIDFPAFNTVDLEKKENEIWLTIPGNLEYKRRDFEGFFKQLQEQKLKTNYKIILLGRSTHKKGNYKEAKKAIAAAGMENQVVLFEKFVDNESFHSYLKQSDYILPLLHPGHSSLQEYQYKISGSFNLAYSYDIPLVLHQEFEKHSEFKEHPTVFYKVEGLIETLNQLGKPVKTPSALKNRIKNQQRENYLSFLRSN